MLENLVKTFRRRTADESAASAIELAIVLPILLLAALALVDMAFFVANWTGTNAGATSAARTIVVTPAATQDDLKAAVLSDAPQLGASDFEVNVAWGEEKTQEYTHHFPDKTATKFVTKKRNVVTQDVTVTVTAKRPYLTVLGKAWGQSAGTGDDMVAKSSCTMSVDRTNGTNWVGEDNYIPGIRWTLVDGVLTVMPEEGYGWGVGISDRKTLTIANSMLSDWVKLTDDQWKSVTEINFEGSVAFGDSEGNRYCPRLYDVKNVTKADLAAWDSSKVEDMSYMFQALKKLKTVNVSDWDTSAVKCIYCIFYNCSGLTSLDVSSWNTSNVKSMECMFYNCASLTTLDVSNWDTSKVTDIRNMFCGCWRLTTLNVSDWDTSGVTNASWAFSNCTSLTALDVSSWDTSSLEDAMEMFERCSSLKALDVSSWDVSNLVRASGMFYNCSSLTSLDVSSWDTSNLHYADWMFAQLMLKTIDLSSWNTSKIICTEFMFEACPWLNTIYASDGWSLTEVASSDGQKMFHGCENLAGAVSYDSSKVGVDMANWETGYLTYKGTKLYDSINASGADLSKLSKLVGVYPYNENGKEIKTLQFSGKGESNAKTVYYAWEFQFSDGSTKRYAMWKLSESERRSLLESQSGNWYIYADDSSSGQGNNCCWKDADDGKVTLWISDTATEVPSQISFSWTAENFRGTAYSYNANPYVSIPIELKE